MRRKPTQLSLDPNQLQLPLAAPGGSDLWRSVESYPERVKEAERARKKRVTRKMKQPDLLAGLKEAPSDGRQPRGRRK